MNKITFGHNYQIDSYTKQQINETLNNATKMLGTKDSFGYGYVGLKERLDALKGEDMFVKQAEKCYRDEISSRKKKLQKLTEEINNLETNPQESIARILGENLLNYSCRLVIDISSQKYFNLENAGK